MNAKYTDLVRVFELAAESSICLRDTGCCTMLRVVSHNYTQRMEVSLERGGSYAEVIRLKRAAEDVMWAMAPSNEQAFPQEIDYRIMPLSPVTDLWWTVTHTCKELYGEGVYSYGQIHEALEFNAEERSMFLLFVAELLRDLSRQYEEFDPSHLIAETV